VRLELGEWLTGIGWVLSVAGVVSILESPLTFEEHGLNEYNRLFGSLSPVNLQVEKKEDCTINYNNPTRSKSIEINKVYLHKADNSVFGLSF